MSRSTLTELEPTMEEFGAWLKTPGFPAPGATVLHHTWSPNAAQYRGRESIVAIRSYHMHNRGASDIMANAYATPDGTIITGRPLDTANWAHAYISRAQPEAEAWDWARHDRMAFNRAGFGIETVGNFDAEDPDGSRAFTTALQALAVVHRVFNLPTNRLFFHRDVADKSCPGTRLNRDVVRDMLGRAMAPKVPVVVLGGTPVPCSPELTGGEWTVYAANFLDALGVPITDVPPGVIHENGRAFVMELAKYAPGWTFPAVNKPQGPRMYPQRTAWVPS